MSDELQHSSTYDRADCYNGATTVACLDDNLAAEFASGTLPKSQRQRVESHLAGCRDCRHLIATLAASGEDAVGNVSGLRDSDVITSPRHHHVASVIGAPADSPPDPRDPQISVGDRIGRYLVLGRLGAGGMGVVLSAYDPQLDRKVAIKLLRTGIGIATGEARARLVREAKAIAQLSHPNVVAVYDVGAIDSSDPARQGEIYIAMEFVEGDTVTQWMRRWKRPWRDVLEVMLQAGRGLAAAHAVGLLHRDFKPDNVLVGSDGRVRVGDFGLARSVMGPDAPTPDHHAIRPAHAVSALHATLTATGTVLGTPRFMAPEQFLGEDTDARSDQFSYCVALYDALYGRHPLQSGTALEMVDKGARALPPPNDSKVPAHIGRAILRGLDPLPAKRFPSMTALLAELTPAPIRVLPRRTIAIVVAIALTATAGAAVLINHRQDRATSREAELIHRIEQLEVERETLLKQVKHDIDNQKAITDLREKLAKKDEEIQTLITRVEELRAATATADATQPSPTTSTVVPRPTTHAPSAVIPHADTPRTPAAIIAEARTSALAVVAHADDTVRGCFAEWAERHPSEAVTLTVALTVAPDGHAHSPNIDGSDDSSLPLCTGDALTRLEFPALDAVVKLRLTLNFKNGALALASSVTSTENVTGIIDLTK